MILQKKVLLKFSLKNIYFYSKQGKSKVLYKRKLISIKKWLQISYLKFLYFPFNIIFILDNKSENSNPTVEKPAEDSQESIDQSETNEAPEDSESPVSDDSETQNESKSDDSETQEESKTDDNESIETTADPSDENAKIEL